MVYVKNGLEISPYDGKLRILSGEYFLSKGQKGKALDEYKLALKDENWRSSAQHLIIQLEKPESEEEKAEREFFNRGREKND